VSPPLTCSQAGLFSAVSTAFIIEVHSKLDPDVDKDSILLLAILSTLNPNTGDPAKSESLLPIAFAAGLMYMSLGCSLVATYLTLVEKQRLNWRSQSMGGSMIERCRDRQHNIDEHQGMRSFLFVTPPWFLQGSIFSTTLGLCPRLVYIHGPQGILILMLPLYMVVLYAFDPVTGKCLSNSPPKTPAFAAPHGERLRNGTLYHMWDIMLCKIYHVILWLPSVEILHHSHNQAPPMAQPTSQNPTPWLAPQSSLWDVILCQIYHMLLWLPLVGINHHPHDTPLPTVQPILQAPPLPTTQNISSNSTATPGPLDQTPSSTTRGPVTTPHWLTSDTLTTLQEENIDDAKCVSWVLQYITDPEALDAAIRFAAVVRWYEKGLNMEESHKLINSTLKECFDSTGTTPPWLRDRAYYSLQAIMWFRVCRPRAPEESAVTSSHPVIPCDTACLDPVTIFTFLHSFFF